MSETLVVNVKTVGPRGYDVYIGRANVRYGLMASPFANPFPIGPGCTRAQSIALYREHLERLLQAQPRLRAELKALRGRRLGCWCKGPSGKKDIPCHGDVLVEAIARLFGGGRSEPAASAAAERGGREGEEQIHVEP